MDAAIRSCICSPVSLGPSSSRGIKVNRVLCVLKPSSPPISSLSCNRSPIFSVVGAFANLVCLPALAAEEVFESSLASLSSSPAAEAASTQVPDKSSAVQSSVQSVEAVAAADDGYGNLIISILGTASFIGLCLVTIGVIYLAVDEFLEKRKRNEETKKASEEEASVKKKPSGSLTSRGVAKGFGKKREVDE